jgi:flagellar motor protein MotB
MMMHTSETRLSRARAAAAAGMIGAVGLMVAGLGGCAGQNQALMERDRNLADRNTKLAQENASLHDLNQQLQNGMSARDDAIAKQQKLLEEMKAGHAELAAQIDNLAKMNSTIKFGNLLDPETNQALGELASQHPDLLDYDAQLGLVRFKSDVTFDSGSDRLRDAAKNTLRQFAQILTSTAMGYDVNIVGHTDGQPIQHIAKTAPTNMHLSCLRAISVRTELVGYGVQPERCEASGWGEFRPLEANGPSGKSMKNRRVEVYLTRPVRGMGAKTDMPMPMTKPMSTPEPVRNEDYMK